MVDVGKLNSRDDYAWFIDMAEPVMGMQMWEHTSNGWHALPGPVTLLTELLYPVMHDGLRHPDSSWFDSRARHVVPTRLGEWYPEGPVTANRVIVIPMGEYPEEYHIQGLEIGHKKSND